MVRVIEFKSRNAYDSWLRGMGESIRIVNVSTTKRWSLVKGFLGDNKTYTVTYEVLNTSGSGSPGQQTSQISPATAKFLAVSIAAVIAAVMLRGGWASLAAVPAVFLLSYVLPVLKGTERKKLIFATVVISVVALVKFTETVVATREERAQARIEQGTAREIAEREAATQRAFTTMTPAAHLAEVKRLLKRGAPDEALTEANKHIEALPSGSLEARTASDLKSRFVADVQRRAAEQAKHAVKESAADAEAARIGFSKTVENEMLDQGWNFEVTTLGAQHTTLRLKWALASKAVAHQLTENTEVFDTARQLGFKRMELTDGFDETWTWKLE